jgi:hypothetical protein
MFVASVRAGKKAKLLFLLGFGAATYAGTQKRFRRVAI